MTRGTSGISLHAAPSGLGVVPVARGPGAEAPRLHDDAPPGHRLQHRPVGIMFRGLKRPGYTTMPLRGTDCSTAPSGLGRGVGIMFRGLKRPGYTTMPLRGNARPAR